MDSGYRIHRLSPVDRQSVHFYYDVCPESPDGRRVVFFSFDWTPEGDGRARTAPGRAVVTERDGTVVLTVADTVTGDTHGGARTLWVDNDHISYLGEQDGHARTVVVSVSNGSRRSIPGALRMVHPTRPLGLTTAHDFDPDATGPRDAVCLMDLRGGDVRPLFTVADALADHPRGTAFPGVEHVRFYHTKWSPSGKRFFVHCANLSGYTPDGARGEPFEAIFVAEADGSDLRAVRAEGHHLCWGADDDTIVGFTPNPAGGQDLTVFPVAGGEPRVVVERVYGKHASVNAGMTRVLVDVTNAYGYPVKGSGGIYVYDLPESQPRVLATMKMPNPSHSGVHCHPVFSRDERRVYFNAAEDGFRGVYVLDLG